MVDRVDVFSGVGTTLGVKAPVWAATTGNITLAGIQDIDGSTGVDKQRILVHLQTDPVENGIYVMNAGTWQRAKDFDGRRDAVKGTVVFVANPNGGPAAYQVANEDPVDFDVDEVTFVPAPWVEISITPGNFGAVGDGVTDDTLAIQAAMDYINTLDSGANNQISKTLDLDGLTYAVSAGLLSPADVNGFSMQNGSLIAIGAGWTDDEAMLTLRDPQQSADRVFFDCQGLCSGVDVAAGRCEVAGCGVVRFLDYGIKITGPAGDIQVTGCEITQWVDGSDPESADPANFTGKGIWVTINDCKFFRNLIRWCGTPMYFDTGSGSALVSDSHLYNGRSGGINVGITAITAANPGVITVSSTAGMVVGNPVWIETVNGMEEINYTKYYINTIPTGTTLTLKNGAGTPLDTSAFTPYTNSGDLYTTNVEDPKNIVVMGGSVHFTGCYLDNGNIDLYAKTASFTSCQFLMNPDKMVTDYVIGFFADGANDTLGKVTLANNHYLSDRIKWGRLPLVKFHDGSGSWPASLQDDLPTLLRPDNADGRALDIVEGVKIFMGGLLVNDNATPIAIFYSPASSSFGARIQFVDGGTTDYTTPPTVRSSGDDLKLSGEAIVLTNHADSLISVATTEVRVRAPQFSVQKTDGTAGEVVFDATGDAGIYSEDGPANLKFRTNGTDKLVLATDGRLYGSALHNNGGAVTGTTDQHIASGTWTPTLTNTTNLDASTANEGQWIRVGNVVNASCMINIDPTAAASITLGVSLPIASDFGAAIRLCGTAVANTVTECFAIFGDSANDRATVSGIAVSTAAHNILCHFTYVIL